MHKQENHFITQINEFDVNHVMRFEQRTFCLATLLPCECTFCQKVYTFLKMSIIYYLNIFNIKCFLLFFVYVIWPCDVAGRFIFKALYINHRKIDSINLLPDFQFCFSIL